jgi:hypothetical protein
MILALVVAFGLSIWTGRFGYRDWDREAYAECLKDAVGLEEWVLVITDVPLAYIVVDTLPDGRADTVVVDEDIAITEVDENYLVGYIDIDPVGWAESDEEEQRETIVHEVLHIRFWKVTLPLWAADEDAARELEEPFVTELSRSPLFERLCR